MHTISGMLTLIYASPLTVVALYLLMGLLSHVIPMQWLTCLPTTKLMKTLKSLVLLITSLILIMQKQRMLVMVAQGTGGLCQVATTA